MGGEERAISQSLPVSRPGREPVSPRAFQLAEESVTVGGAEARESGNSWGSTPQKTRTLSMGQEKVRPEPRALGVGWGGGGEEGPLLPGFNSMEKPRGRLEIPAEIWKGTRNQPNKLRFSP